MIYASCSPESFARDARALVDGGFALAEVRPIDQFLLSAEVELVACSPASPGRRRPCSCALGAMRRRKTALIAAAPAAIYARPAAVPFV